MIQQKLKGTGVALVTPFTKDGQIDYPALDKLINHCIAGGVEYLVSLGTTGESVTLSKDEKIQVLEYTIQANNGRVPLVAGFGGNNTAELVSEISKFHFKGVDAILSVSPYYNKPTQAGIYAHYKSVAEASPVPVLLYNVPGRTGSNVKAETAIKLGEDFKNIIGIKEAAGDFAQAMQLAKYKPKDFLLISGDDNITMGLIAYGFDGVISVVGQAFPAIFTSMVRASLSGDFAKARDLHYKLNDITDMLFAEGNPAGVKHALRHLGVCNDTVRLPLVGLSQQLQQKLSSAIDEL